jgi:phosphatidylinositol alpha-1,6-mannosyltransferase
LLDKLFSSIRRVITVLKPIADKIIIVTQCFAPDVGGIEQVMAHLAAAWSQVSSVVVLADASKNPRAAQWDKAQPYRIERFSGPKPWRRHQKRRALRKHTASGHTVWLCCDSWKSATTARSAITSTTVTCLCMAHGNDVLDKGSSKRRQRIVAGLQTADAVVAVSQDTLQRVQTLGIDTGVVINNGVTLTSPARPEQACHSKPLMFTVSRLEPRKGHDQVIRAISGLKTQWPGIRYLIAGSGPDRARLQSLVSELQCQEQVIFLGRVSDAEKHYWLQQADLFVMPVRLDTKAHSIEGFGMALAEAQLSGCPVLTGRVGGVLDVVQDRQTGVVCDGDDTTDVQEKITWMLQNPEDCRAFAKQAQLQAQQKFTIPAMAEKYLQLLATHSQQKSRD